MAVSPAKSTNYSSTLFTESAGVVLFNQNAGRVCLLHHKAKNQRLLPKGRRNIGESRAQAAVREAREETGFRCRLLPVTLQSRQPHANDLPDTPDEVNEAEKVVEPFMFTIRELGEGRVKVIWWFVAVVELDEGGKVMMEREGGESQFEAQWFSFDEAVGEATFESEREVLREGIKVFRGTMGEAEEGKGGE